MLYRLTVDGQEFGACGKQGVAAIVMYDPHAVFTDRYIGREQSPALFYIGCVSRHKGIGNTAMSQAAKRCKGLQAPVCFQKGSWSL